MTPEQIAQIDQEYRALSGNESLRDGLSGDLGGRDWFRANQALIGMPADPEQRLLEETLRTIQEYDFERNGFSNAFNNGLQQLVNDNGARLDAAIEVLRSARDAYIAIKNVQNETALRQALGDVREHLQGFQEARDATADLAANTVATAAGIAVVVASGGVATPIVIALAAGAGGAAQALTRMGVSNSFSWEQLTADFALGAVNAATAVLSFPAATRAAIANGTAQIGILRQVAGSAFAGGASAGGLGAALNDDTWSRGFAAGVINVAQAATISGFASTALPTMIGAGVIAARRAIPFFSRVAAYTGSTVRNVFDGPWVRNFVNGTQSILDYLQATLNWANKADQIAQRLVAAGNETEAITRDAIYQILADANWGQTQRELVVETAMNTLRAHRSEMQTLGLAGTRTLMEDGLRINMVNMNQVSEVLRSRVNAAGGITASMAEIDTLIQRVSTYANVDIAALRTELEALYPGRTFDTIYVNRILGVIDPSRVTPTGQLHHVISTRVRRALQEHQTLRDLYSARDPRFTVRAIDGTAHNGYFGWHEQLDNRIVAWIQDAANENATAQQFEAWLRTRYSEPDLLWRFPTGF